jgi:hypothetical protein
MGPRWLVIALFGLGCAAYTDPPESVLWRSRLLAEIDRLDAELLRLEQALGRPPAADDERAAAAERLALLAERDVLVYDTWLELLGELPPEAQASARLRLDPRVQAAQRANTRELRPLLDRFGWYPRSEFGAQADRDAWRVVQHADHDPQLQREVLAVLEGLLEVGETDPLHFAYLADRVAVAQGELQPFGTQGRCRGAGIWEPLPIEDPAGVDPRRAAVGLPPLAEYVREAAAACP